MLQTTSDLVLASFDEDDQCWEAEDSSLSVEGERTVNGMSQQLLCGDVGMLARWLSGSFSLPLPPFVSYHVVQIISPRFQCW